MGVAGQIARAFLHSKLTPLVTLASLAVGVLAVLGTPREEEPQISVPMIDVFASFPGAGPTEVENLLARPLEKLMWEIPAVEHVYTTSGEGFALVTVRFRVGENQETSVTRVHAKLFSAMDRIPPGATPPLVQPHTIDDVPILTLTLSSDVYGSNDLRRMARLLEDDLRTLPDVAATFLTGGAPRQLQVALDPARLTAQGVTAGEVALALQSAGTRMIAGELTGRNMVYQIAIGAPVTSAEDLAGILVARRQGGSVPLSAVATVTDTHGEPEAYVTHHVSGRASQAVTLALAKRPGANATDVAHVALARVEEARGRILPADVTVTVTRNYGETARDKADELMFHLLLATLSVTVLIGIFLGWREALVVLVAVPVTLGLTLFVYYALGYTLNRITLFALIFSIGILVDDAIVVVENIYRHLQLRPEAPDEAAVEGVDEVGNPTILATATVIVAILPMAFVSGLMGPYMRPIPVGASAAMLASLGVAFVITPWLALRLLRGHVPPAAVKPEPGSDAEAAPSSRFARFFAGALRPLLTREAPGRFRRFMVYGGVGILLLLSMGLLVIRAVQVKMLPFDNKSEFQVVLDLPEGTALETTDRVAQEVSAWLRQVPEVVSTQTYAGTAAPFNFNGLVRHYFLRRGGHVADVQVNLLPRDERRRQSHEIAVAVRPAVDSIARRHGARAVIAEIPPGPPVLSTLVAEVYAGSDSARRELAERVMAVMEGTPGVVDVDWSTEAAQPRRTFRIDRDLVVRAGADVEQVARTLALGLSGAPAGRLVDPLSREPVLIIPRMRIAERTLPEDLLSLPVSTATGPMPLARFVTVDSGVREPARFRKNLRPVIYVTGDVAGEIESPVYAILGVNRTLDTVRVDGVRVTRYNAIQPATLTEPAIKWDGEWQITIEVFRDLGLAFAAVLLLIYVLVVGWFQSFRLPLVIMAPIPLTLIGILPGHALSGAFFTATSMIGMIALAGIIVRNSILLVDFIQLARARGRPLAEAVIEAGTVRFRPIALTAAAVVIGGLVMVLDPIFQGLAVALISGALVATALTMIVVPLLYWELERRSSGEG